jgi:hypothetical protein
MNDAQFLDDLPAALALVDGCHADLHQRRREIEVTLGALRSVAALVERASRPYAPASRYRRYNDEQVRRLQVVVLLR